MYLCSIVFVYCLYKGEDVLSWKTCIWSYCHVFGQYNMFKLPEGCENIGKSSYLNLPHIGFTLFSPIKGRIDSLTVYIYKAETCTNILRYNTCMSSSPGDRKWRKLSHNGCTAGNFDLHDHGLLLLTFSTGPMEWSAGNSYQAEALTNVLWYHTCRSSHPEDRKLSITELKWDARTLTDIPGNTAHWFFAFFWLTEDSRNKN